MQDSSIGKLLQPSIASYKQKNNFASNVPELLDDAWVNVEDVGMRIVKMLRERNQAVLIPLHTPEMFARIRCALHSTAAVAKSSVAIAKTTSAVAEAAPIAAKTTAAAAEATASAASIAESVGTT